MEDSFTQGIFHVTFWSLMKTWTLKFNKVNYDNFERLRKGIKCVETRAASPKYQNIEKGDTLVFVCGKEKFSKKIIKKYHFKSIDLLLKNIPLKKIMPVVKTKKEAKEKWYSYPGYKLKLEKFGIFAFKLN